MDLLARGVSYKYDSPQEHLALTALRRDRKVQFLKTMAVINAILVVGNKVSAAVQNAPPSKTGGEALTKTLDQLREMLLPEVKEQRETKAAEAKRILADELAKGPLTVKRQSFDKKTSKRVKMGGGNRR